jgi:hypothetical protein
MKNPFSKHMTVHSNRPASRRIRRLRVQQLLEIKCFQNQKGQNFIKNLIADIKKVKKLN